MYYLKANGHIYFLALKDCKLWSTCGSFTVQEHWHTLQTSRHKYLPFIQHLNTLQILRHKERFTLYPTSEIWQLKCSFRNIAWHHYTALSCRICFPLFPPHTKPLPLPLGQSDIVWTQTCKHRVGGTQECVAQYTEIYSNLT